MSDRREDIEREIFNLRRDISIQLRFGNAEEANRLLGEVAELERQKQNLKPKGNESCQNSLRV